ncbi:MAG: hypothetical protein DHS20C05_03190 [Hyphococcus sp.]|nr:MAG: hypothetical protein DHS20C05_03190 [Marinicaulis sp.]
MRTLPHKALLGLGVFLLAACGGAHTPAKYSLSQCSRLGLTDAVSGETIRGVEDFAVDWESQTIFLSAYDRRAVEKAARDRAETLPQGGIYAVLIDEVFDREKDTLSISPLIAEDKFPGGLRPHGISFDADTQELLFINRSYRQQGRRWIMAPNVHRISLQGEAVISLSETTHCAANNLFKSSDSIYVSFDHQFCDWRGVFENIFGLRQSGFLKQTDDVILSKMKYANGITQISDEHIFIAATREKKLYKVDLETGKILYRYKVPGGPDNITIGYDDNAITALHPSLIKLAMNRKLGIGKAPSRIMKLNPVTDKTIMLFDDAKGAFFSAATVGVETERGLIAGSVTDDGILVCGVAGE